LRDTKWNLHASFYFPEAKKPDDIYRIIENKLYEAYPSSYKKRVNMKNKKVIDFGHFSIMITDDSDVEVNGFPVTFSFQQMNVTLYNAEKYLSELRSLFHTFEVQLSPIRTSYAMDIYYPTKQNPFFGLMIQRLGVDNVKQFECVFPINALFIEKNQSADNIDREVLRVFKEKISINHRSFDSLEKVALKALMLR